MSINPRHLHMVSDLVKVKYPRYWCNVQDSIWATRILTLALRIEALM